MKSKKVLVSMKVKAMKQMRIAEKNFIQSSGVPYSMRVSNLKYGRTDW